MLRKLLSYFDLNGRRRPQSVSEVIDSLEIICSQLQILAQDKETVIQSRAEEIIRLERLQEEDLEERNRAFAVRDKILNLISA